MCQPNSDVSAVILALLNLKDRCKVGRMDLMRISESEVAFICMLSRFR